MSFVGSRGESARERRRRLPLIAGALLVAACTGGGTSPGEGGGGAGGSAADATSSTTTGSNGPAGPSSTGSTTSGPGRECTFAILEDVTYDPGEARFEGTVVPGFGGPEADRGWVFFPNRAHEVDLAVEAESGGDGVLLAEDVDPERGVLGALFAPSEGTLIVAADGWSLRDVRVVELDGDGAPLDGGRCFDLGDFTGDVVEPFGWLCNPAYHAAADGCDCGCGLPDPDCELPDQPLLNCFDGQSCSATGTCEGIPGAWTCEDAAWDDGATCDCACGVPDVDCADEERPVAGCDAGDSCQEGVCVPPDETGDCADSTDDDRDGRIDCADADDCGGDVACTPGDTPRDGACAVHSDCAAVAGADPLCVGSVLGPAVSFCSEWCDLAVDDCGAGAFCLDVGSSRGVCLTTCDPDGDDCAEGFACAEPDVGGERLGCVPVPPPPPDGWVCADGLYGTDDGCDCGCGVIDPDCPDATADVCEFCGPSSCANDGTGDGCDPALLDPADGAVCSG